MLWYILAGAAALGIGPVAFRSEMNGLLLVIGLAGILLFGLALRYVEDFVDYTRCSLGASAVCGEMQRAAAMAAWPKQAVVSGWSVQQMQDYRDDQGWPHRWTMQRREMLGGDEVTTEQYCAGYRFPQTMEDYLKQCYDRKVVTPGLTMGRLIATPGRKEPMAPYDLDRLNRDWTSATAPTPPGYTAFTASR